MKTSSAKAKGHKLEALIRDKLIEVFGLSTDDIRIPVGSENGSDIKLSKNAQEVFPFVVEAKSRAKFAMTSYMDQAIGHKTEKLEPVVIIKANRKKPLVCLDFDYFLRLIHDKNLHQMQSRKR